MNYTKGEWKPDFAQMTGHCGIAINAGDKQIANVYLCLLDSNWEGNPVERIENEEAKANANLIAAAPVMYKALKAFDHYLNASPPHNMKLKAYAVKLMDKAVAKAEGK